MIHAQLDPKIMEAYAELWVEAMIEEPHRFTFTVDEVLNKCEGWLAYPTNLKLVQIAAANAEFLIYLLTKMSKMLRPARGSEQELELYHQARDKHAQACELAVKISKMLQKIMPEERIGELYNTIWNEMGVKP